MRLVEARSKSRRATWAANRSPDSTSPSGDARTFPAVAVRVNTHGVTLDEPWKIWMQRHLSADELNPLHVQARALINDLLPARCGERTMNAIGSTASVTVNAGQLATASELKPYEFGLLGCFSRHLAHRPILPLCARKMG